jgi:hypothetical protein
VTHSSDYYDELLAQFLLDQWFNDPWDYRIYERREILDAERSHLLNCDTKLQVEKEPEWSCGCYSEYTRGDGFLIHTMIFCVCGLSVPVRYRYGLDSPNLISELESFESTWDCRIDPEVNPR